MERAQPASSGQARRDPRRSAGFSMIEMIIVLVVIAVLVSLASVNFSNRGAAAIAAMKSDLRNLATAQEAYFSTNESYAASTDLLNFDLSPQVSLELIANDRGWSARTEHTLKPEYHCAAFYGPGVEPYSPATIEGRIECLPSTAGGCFGG